MDLAAPGTDILSTVPTRGRDIYGYKSGTSMATPLVAGAFASQPASSPYPESLLDVRPRG